MKIVLVLLARIGSKRIPKKPLTTLGGKPLIEWTLETMARFSYPSYVFTDSQEIWDLVLKYNLNPREKILENKEGKHYTSEELQHYNKEMKADVIVLFQLTSPFRDVEMIDEWINNFQYYNVNCALTVYPVKDIFYNKDGERVFPIHRGYQNNNILYKETGSLYIFEKKQIEKNHLTDGTRKLLIDSYNFDIDTYDDLQRAELYLKQEKEMITCH